MRKRFKVGDHVAWKSEAGHVNGTIIKAHTKDFDFKGHAHHASQDGPHTKQEPQDGPHRGV
jgi:hypothetical protein